MDAGAQPGMALQAGLGSGEAFGAVCEDKYQVHMACAGKGKIIDTKTGKA